MTKFLPVILLVVMVLGGIFALTSIKHTQLLKLLAQSSQPETICKGNAVYKKCSGAQCTDELVTTCDTNKASTFNGIAYKGEYCTLGNCCPRGTVWDPPAKQCTAVCSKEVDGSNKVLGYYCDVTTMYASYGDFCGGDKAVGSCEQKGEQCGSNFCAKGAKCECSQFCVVPGSVPSGGGCCSNASCQQGLTCSSETFTCTSPNTTGSQQLQSGTAGQATSGPPLPANANYYADCSTTEQETGEHVCEWKSNSGNTTQNQNVRIAPPTPIDMDGKDMQCYPLDCFIKDDSHYYLTCDTPNGCKWNSKEKTAPHPATSVRHILLPPPPPGDANFTAQCDDQGANCRWISRQAPVINGITAETQVCRSNSDVQGRTDAAKVALQLANEERVKRGIPALEWDDYMARKTREATEQAGKDQYRGHMDFGGYASAELVTWAGYPEGAINSWMNSSKGHREIMLLPAFTRAGLGMECHDARWSMVLR